MSYRFARTMLSAACLLLPAVAIATDLIPVEDFARHVMLSQPTLSPDGQYIAVNMNDISGDSHALAVYNVSEMSRPVSVLRLPKYEVAVGIIWVSNTRLVVEKGKQYGSIDKPAATGEVLATDLDGKNQDYLYGYKGSYGTCRYAQHRSWLGLRGWPSHSAQRPLLLGHAGLGQQRLQHALRCERGQEHAPSDWPDQCGRPELHGRRRRPGPLRLRLQR
jgi:hypothetical protein